MRCRTLGFAASLALVPLSVAAEAVNPNSVVIAFRTQIAQCWAPPAQAANARGLVVVVRVKLKRDGSLAGEPVVVNSGTGMFNVVAKSALAALRRCQPFKLPAAAYEVWKEVELSFVPEKIQ